MIDTKERYVILVDDDIMVLQALKNQLQSFMDGNIQFETCQSAEEAIEVIDDILVAGNQISVVISDYLMGGMSGSEFIVNVHDHLPQTRKILLTGQADISGVSKAINKGALYRYISKPWDANEMRLTLTQALHDFDMEDMLHKTNEELRILDSNLKRNVTSQIRVLTDKNNEFHNSAVHASHVQASLFPPLHKIQKYLQVSEIYLRPLLQLSGDFYWMSPPQPDKSIYFAVGDCTGHGTSAGFMSVLNISILNEALLRCNDRSPKGIVAYVLARLSEINPTQDETQNVHLKSEITLLKFRMADSCVDFASNGNGFIALCRETNEVIYPLDSNKSLLDPYGNRTIRQGTLEKFEHLNLILFTDGVTNQFGGHNNKKLTRKGLAQWVVQNNSSSFPQTYRSLFEHHCQNQEQLDDVLLVAFHCLKNGGLSDMAVIN